MVHDFKNQMPFWFFSRGSEFLFYVLKFLPQLIGDLSKQILRKIIAMLSLA